MSSKDFREEAITEINIAPLVDVILVLLIIFMATAPLIQKKVIQVNVPQVAHNEPAATKTLEIGLNEKHEVYLGSTLINFEDLPYQLAGLSRVDPLLHVSIVADQSVAYGEVAKILDAVRGAGIKKVALQVRSQKKTS